ncbi:hypothetical protein GQ600_18342 [Phytophthora cactorum]|nr:hypothetical protein GQ600_18342 [Phytophthora cactorum]
MLWSSLDGTSAILAPSHLPCDPENTHVRSSPSWTLKSTSSLARASTTSWATPTRAGVRPCCRPARTFTPELNRTRETWRSQPSRCPLRPHGGRGSATYWLASQPTNAYCPCRYHMKMGYCCHLLFAQQSRSVVDSLARNLSQQEARPEYGRPQSIGHALQRL